MNVSESDGVSGEKRRNRDGEGNQRSFLPLLSQLQAISYWLTQEYLMLVPAINYDSAAEACKLAFKHTHTLTANCRHYKCAGHRNMYIDVCRGERFWGDTGWVLQSQGETLWQPASPPQYHGVHLFLLFYFHPSPPSLPIPLKNQHHSYSSAGLLTIPYIAWLHSSYVTHPHHLSISQSCRSLPLFQCFSKSPSVSFHLSFSPKWLSLSISLSLCYECARRSWDLHLCGSVSSFLLSAATCRIHRSTSHICSSSLQQAHTPTCCMHARTHTHCGTNTHFKFRLCCCVQLRPEFWSI